MARRLVLGCRPHHEYGPHPGNLKGQARREERGEREGGRELNSRRTILAAVLVLAGTAPRVASAAEAPAAGASAPAVAPADTGTAAAPPTTGPAPGSSI